MSRLRKTPAVTEDTHYVKIHDVETDEITTLPVLHVMRKYMHVQEDGNTRPYTLSDFYFESGEPLPTVSVGLMKTLGGYANKAKKKFDSVRDSAKKKYDSAKKKANKAMSDFKEGYNNGEEGSEEPKSEMAATESPKLVY